MSCHAELTNLNHIARELSPSSHLNKACKKGQRHGTCQEVQKSDGVSVYLMPIVSFGSHIPDESSEHIAAV